MGGEGEESGGESSRWTVRNVWGGGWGRRRNEE